MIYEEWVLKTKWFSEATPKNPKYASITIGSGDNGVVTVTFGTIGTLGNSYSLEVVGGSGVNVAMSVTVANTKITITLGTDGAGALDATKNTATLIATAIDALDGFSAVASGTGATAIAAAIAEADFTGGQYGTPCVEKFTIIQDETYYYKCVQEGNETDVAWERFTPATY